MFIGINSSDSEANIALQGAKVGDIIEITATVTEITGKRYLAEATSVEVSEPEIEDEDEGDDEDEEDMEEEAPRRSPRAIQRLAEEE